MPKGTSLLDPRNQHGGKASVGVMETQVSQVIATKYWWVGDFTPCWVTLKPDILGVYRNTNFLKNTELTMWEGLKCQSNPDSSSGHSSGLRGSRSVWHSGHTTSKWVPGPAASCRLGPEPVLCSARVCRPAIPASPVSRVNTPQPDSESAF